MSEFWTWTDYWDFREAAKKERRYFWRTQTKVFLDAIRRTSKKRVSVIPKGTHFWRAQTGHEWVEHTIPCPYPESRMVPLRNRAREGRINPQGIPVLYLATTRETAMSETRPWVGTFISLGEFVTTRDLQVIDCSRYHARKNFYFREEPPRKDIERIVWTHIDRAFAEPVSRADDAADYVPTQILAEMFRDMGFEGIVYKSIFGHKSRNIALFDIESARLVNRSLHEVVETKFKFAERDKNYWCRPPLDQARRVADIRFRR